ncbi:hypothetical protein M413DRAFT_9199 [Hebeloma cylindrosporum]|uniref:Uncharacterized protein n=1 Tax=Hebeloma cylindrosporum TaxID=76867 RepID=A0A0C2YVH6_HEBCY|nr:hypothetical protein M413DRAFT_9199 [Hebeloma cylindrosporum h7]
MEGLNKGNKEHDDEYDEKHGKDHGKDHGKEQDEEHDKNLESDEARPSGKGNGKRGRLPLESKAIAGWKVIWFKVPIDKVAKLAGIHRQPTRDAANLWNDFQMWRQLVDPPSEKESMAECTVHIKAEYLKFKDDLSDKLEQIMPSMPFKLQPPKSAASMKKFMSFHWSFRYRANKALKMLKMAADQDLPKVINSLLENVPQTSEKHVDGILAQASEKPADGILACYRQKQ